MAEHKSRTSYVKAARADRDRKKKKSKVFASPNKGSFLHKFGKAVGYIVMLIGITAFFALLIRNTYHGIGLDDENIFFAGIFAAGLMIYLVALRASKRMTRFRFYRTFLEEKEYIYISELSVLTGRKVKFLQNDLWNMMKKKLFLQAHMNDNGMVLFLTRDAYERYLRGELIPMEKEEDGDEIPASGKAEQNDSSTPEEEKKASDSGLGLGSKIGSFFEKWKRNQPGMDDTDRNDEKLSGDEETSESDSQPDFDPFCDSHLHDIDRLIRQISDKQIKASAASICVRGKQIMFYKDTTMKKDVERFLFNYLPVTKSLLETCAELERENMESENQDLKGILNTIQHSFDSYVEKLLEEKRMDVETDIASMEMMLMNME